MKFSLSTHLFAYDALSEDHIEMVANNGLSAIEVWCMNPHFSFHNWQNVKKLSKLLEKFRLSVSSLHTPFYRNFDELYAKNTFSIASPDEQVRKIAIDEISISFKVASDLGASYSVVHAGDKGDKADKEHKNKLFSSLEKLISLANQLKINIALENVIGDLSSATQLKSIISTFSSPNLYACIDTGHAFINKELPNCINTLSSLLKTTHIHDNNGEKDDHLFPFLGKIEWRPIVKAFKEIKYDGYWVLEPRKYEDSYEKHFEKLKTSISKLQALEYE